MPIEIHAPLDAPFKPSPKLLKTQETIYNKFENQIGNGHGVISVQLDRAFYYPGETVNGKVFIMMNTEMKCDRVKLSV